MCFGGLMSSVSARCNLVEGDDFLNIVMKGDVYILQAAALKELLIESIELEKSISQLSLTGVNTKIYFFYQTFLTDLSLFN